MHMVAPLDKHFTLLYTLLKEHIADDVDYKVLCNLLISRHEILSRILKSGIIGKEVVKGNLRGHFMFIAGSFSRQI